MSPAAAASLLPPPATAAASPPVRSGGGDGAVPATGSLLLDLIEGRSPPLPAHVGGEIATASARGWGGERERVAREKGIRTMSSWSSRGDKDGREWIRRIRLDLIFSGICFLKNLHL